MLSLPRARRALSFDTAPWVQKIKIFAPAISKCSLGPGLIGNDDNGFAAKLARGIVETGIPSEVIACFHSQKGFVLCKVAGIPFSCHAQKLRRCSTMVFCAFLMRFKNK